MVTTSFNRGRPPKGAIQKKIRFPPKVTHILRIFTALSFLICQVFVNGQGITHNQVTKAPKATENKPVKSSKAKIDKQLSRKKAKSGDLSQDHTSIPSTLSTITPQPTDKSTNDSNDEICGFKPIVAVISHAQNSTDDIFWTTWRRGAEAATSESAHLKWIPVGYDAKAAVETLEEACKSSDAVVITVPYANGTKEYSIMDQAINRCISSGKPLFTTNTDTYHNEKVYAYVGSSNYHMGTQCAKSILFPDDPDVITNRKEAPEISTIPNSTVNYRVYWDASDMKNEGISQRLQGLEKVFSDYNINLEIFLPTGNADCPCATKYPAGVSVEEGVGLRVDIKGSTYQYPPRYGMDACSQHDRQLEPDCNSASPPDFCEKGWCYVDSDNCDAERFQPESIGNYNWTDFRGKELEYSYETCGSNNSYLNWFDGSAGSDDNIEEGLSANNTITIVLSSNWAGKFVPNVFICGDEAFQMRGISQYGQSPFLQGLSAVSAATVAAVSLEKDIPWEANKGNAGATSSSEMHSVHMINPKMTDPLSRYGRAVVNILTLFEVNRGVTWDVWHDAEFESDWIMQFPPLEYIGSPSANLPVPETCKDVTNCDNDFRLFECSNEQPCARKKFCRNSFVHGDNFNDTDVPVYREFLTGELKCKDVDTEEYFEAGLCREVASTRTSEESEAKNLCVGHSFELYDRMYNHIIQAEHFVDITSLDSFDLIGTNTQRKFLKDGMQFAAMVRNALTYLASTGREITIKCHFGSIPGIEISEMFDKGSVQVNNNEQTEHILKEITKGLDQYPDQKLTVWVGTYRYNLSNWNHGKIIAIDGKKLITGGTNYYSQHYLQEDPVHDVSMQISGGPAITAHKFAEALWRTSCEWWGLAPSHIDTTWREPDGTIRGMTQITSELPDGGIIGLDFCPPAYSNAVADGILEEPTQANRWEKTGISVIPAARLGNLGGSIEKGSHTSDLAMIALMEEAQTSIKFSQQDMLPVILESAALWSVGHGGDHLNSGVTRTAFEDNWRIIGGVAKAMSRNVDAYMMVSAPCAWGADDPHYMQSQFQYNCNHDKTISDTKTTEKGVGFDFWHSVYTNGTGFWGAITSATDYVSGIDIGYDRWPVAKDIYKERAHIKNGETRASHFMDGNRRLQGESKNELELLSYGYGWSIENIADWIFAYYMIVQEARPTNDDGSLMNADEIVDHICAYAHIGHLRLTAEEKTYKRGEDPGGQIGNHAKILMVDDQAFYMGSDNAYGSGLAEFGLITDDAEKTGEFNQQYWKPKWEQVLGTSADGDSLVSGSSTLDGVCQWKKRLEDRPAPWNNLQESMCRTFTAGYPCNNNKCNWERSWFPRSADWETEYCTISSKENGEGCLEDYECQTGRCSSDLECGDLLQDGNGCMRHNDCANGWCGWNFACGGSALKDGQKCVSSDGCESQFCDLSFTCAAKYRDGVTCVTDADCLSDHCTNTFTCGWLDDRALCVTDSDCKTDHCNSFFACGHVENGGTCLFDNDCASEHCDWSFTCENKLQRGETCTLSENCESGLCNSMFTCGKNQDKDSCIFNGDCVSDYCNIALGHFVCGKHDNGVSCLRDSNCQSNRCSRDPNSWFPFFYICQELGNPGAKCGRNSDCRSLYCDSRWRGWSRVHECR